VSARAADRWRLTLPLVLPVLGGLAYLTAFGAPVRLIAINAGALVLGSLWVLAGRLPSGREARLGLAALGAALLFVPLLLHLEVGGVSRWLPLGPVLLHSGPLLLPLVTVIAAGEPRWGPGLLALACAALAVQPDAGTLAGLAAASAVLAAAHRSAGFALVAGAALALTLATWNAGTLEPQVFTETVLPHVWRASPVAAVLLGGVLLVATPVLLVSGLRTQGLALAALLTGFGAAALLGPFPYPLIGHGAAPILGLALALGAAGIAARR
jgi:hypothetical protein